RSTDVWVAGVSGDRPRRGIDLIVARTRREVSGAGDRADPEAVVALATTSRQIPVRGWQGSACEIFCEQRRTNISNNSEYWTTINEESWAEQKLTLKVYCRMQVW